MAGFEAATGQDHGPGPDVHEALRCLRPYALDAPVGSGQEVGHGGFVDHVDAPPLSGAEQSLRQPGATAPELDDRAGGERKFGPPAVRPFDTAQS